MFAPLLNPVVYAIVAMFAAFCLLDAVHQARRFAAQPSWPLRGLVAFALYLAAAVYAPLLWDGWLHAHSLTGVGGWPWPAQALVGFLVFELGLWAWHRTMHATDFLWRHFHQTHHSAERIDIYGAFWFHPLDMLGFTLLGSLCLMGLLGVDAEAAIAVNLTAAFLSMFTHANIRTPRWLGWFVSRPEMHALHHQRGLHRYNYSDLPLWDMVFGTYRNPETWEGEAGFHEGGSTRLWSLLIGRKIA